MAYVHLPSFEHFLKKETATAYVFCHAEGRFANQSSDSSGYGKRWFSV